MEIAANALASSRQTISVLIPLYNESPNIPQIYDRVSNQLRALDISWKIYFIDDGSTDGSSEALDCLAEKNGNIVVIHFSRNFGHQAAVSAGLDSADGNALVIMDADLQDPPEVIPEFLQKWREGYQVVFGIRSKRKESLVKRFFYAAYYRFLHRIAEIDIPLDSGDFCLMDRQVADRIRALPERCRFIRGLRSWVGFRQTGVVYERQSRLNGRSKYSLWKLVYLGLDGITSFSKFPLRLVSVLGLVISATSAVIALVYFWKKVTVGISPPGFASLMVSIFFLAGIQLITLGIIAEYLAVVFDETKRRPLYVVRNIVNNPQDAA